MAEGQPDDWIFVDWVDFPMHKRGVLCFEQILFCKALETMASCAAILCDNPDPQPPQGCITKEKYANDAERYTILAQSLNKKLKATFWDDERKAFIHAIEDGEKNGMVTKFPNMFAIIYDMVDEDDKQAILRHVLQHRQLQSVFYI